MISETITIINKLGLHARAAARLVTPASSFACNVDIMKDGQKVNGKSIMGIMMLAASRVITSYSIHYTKLYDARLICYCPPRWPLR